MERLGWGRIVNLGATSGFVRSHSVYGLAKAALLHLTESLALELAPTITVNAVVPSQIASERTDTMPGLQGRGDRRHAARPPGDRGRDRPAWSRWSARRTSTSSPVARLSWMAAARCRAFPASGSPAQTKGTSAADRAALRNDTHRPPTCAGLASDWTQGATACKSHDKQRSPEKDRFYVVFHFAPANQSLGRLCRQFQGQRHADARARPRPTSPILDGSGALRAAADPRISTGKLIAKFVGDLGGKAPRPVSSAMASRPTCVNAALANGTMGYACDVEPHHPEACCIRSRS